MLREHVKELTDLGKIAKSLLDEGKLVPDDLVIEMLTERLIHEDSLGGVILDGFPRTLTQAESLENISNKFPIKKVVVFEANQEELTKRILLRGEISGRSDDTEESIRIRLEVYQKDTEPLINFYEDKGIVTKINAVGGIDDIYKLISKEF
jgi:adenylate kinase